MFRTFRNAISEWRKLGVGEKFFWHDARMVFVELPVDGSKVRNWLPWPLSLDKPARATLFIAHYPDMTFAPPYQEAALLLHVRLGEVVRAVHYPWIVLNNDRGLILGREMLGLPKKMAEISFNETDEGFTGTVHRHGCELIRIEGKKGPPVAKPPAGLGQRTINVRGMLNLLSPAHLLMFNPIEEVNSCQELTHVKVQVRSSEDDPIGIVSGEPIRATLRSCDIGPGLPPVRLFPVSPYFTAHLMSLRAR